MTAPMIESILIANRGEIARRIMRTCREMGMRSIAVYSDADRELPFVAEADLALRLGAAPAAESYLDVEKLITLALGNGADAIHPGYGFLAENPQLSAACERHGIAFIGPPADVIRSMGDKGEAKQRMEAAGVPVLPGYIGEDQDEATLLEAARRIGLPVLFKAVAGGGGRGIRRVDSEGEFARELAAATREATSAFGDGRMMIEKYLPASRHVEFQVLADSQGTVLHLFERECSVQRRHQKIVEETPSPALDAPLRTRMSEAAVRAARAIGYVGAGTVEFLVEGEAFYFLEMNTRLQVEHPVTELTLGLDLVRLQIEVAEGRPLALEQDALHPNGHAIECRLNAEDPARGFLPSVGPLRAFAFPEGPGLRVDAGYAPGNAVGPHYDSLLAKLIAWGPTRQEALRRMGRLLAQSRVSGIATNLGFLQSVVSHAAFRSGAYTTRFIDEHGEALSSPEVPAHLERERLLAAAAIEAWLQRQAQSPDADGDASPWQRLGESPRFRQLPALLSRCDTFGEQRYDVAGEVLPAEGDDLAITARLDGVPYRALFRPGRGEGRPGEGRGVLDLEELRLPLWWDAAGTQRWLTLRGLHVRYTAENPALPGARGAAEQEAAERLRAPLPGKMVKLDVRVGDTVQEDQLLAVMEAMKVEHKITAPYAGKVTRILFGEGELVNRDDQLFELEPDSG